MNGSSDALTLALARLMRWAMVASGTRNAAAISRVVRPPTARSVSGMADAGVSDGWQHMNIRISVSSCARRRLRGWIDQRGGEVLPPAAGVVAAVLVDHAAGRDADQPAERVVGHAVGRPLRRGGDERLLHGVLGVGEVAVAADDGTEDLRRELAQQALGARPAVDHTSGSGALSTSRTSIGWRIGTPFGPGAADAWAAISSARSRRLDVDEPVAGEQLLGLGVGAVGDHRGAGAVRHDELRLVGPGQALRVDQLAALEELLR